MTHHSVNLTIKQTFTGGHDYRVLIAEDESRLRGVFCDWFASRGDVPEPAEDGVEALAPAGINEYDVVLLDIMMPKLEGGVVFGFELPS